ncbi:ABC transporter substrate-binding protein [Buchananella felis]|uniref:ABC transporter substrate-binding protein n=1 Tax=Buchananella felis TaxID=3231492 RepID=UPI003529BD80
MQNRPKKWVAFAAMSAAAAMLLSACGGKTDEAKPAGAESVITAGVAYETTNYNPSNTTSALAMGSNWHVVEGLYETNMATGEIYAALAAGDPTKVSDTEYEVTLRDGAKFSDGSDVTSADVVESFKRSTAEGNLYAGFLDFVDTVDAKDEKTVSIKLKNPFTLVKERLAVVKVVPAASTEDDMTKMPIGSGPYKYEAITESELTAVKNEHYNGPRPATTDRLKWSVLKDDTARTTAAQDGSIDVMESVPAENIALLEAAGWKVEKVAGFNLPFVLFNNAKAPFTDARVRQAFLYAIDVDKLISNNMSGEAKAATSFLPEDHPNYKKAEVQYNYDPEKAKTLLAEAGVKDLSITMLTTDHTWIANLAPQIKNDLEAVGVKVNLQSMASSALYKDNLDIDNATFDIAVAPGDPSVFGKDPALLMNWWYGPGKWTDYRTFWAKGDKAKFEGLKAIIDEAVTLEGAEQQKKWDEAQDYISREVPLYPLFHRNIITAYNSAKIDGFTPIGTTGLSLLGATVK